MRISDHVIFLELCKEMGNILILYAYIFFYIIILNVDKKHFKSYFSY